MKKLLLLFVAIVIGLTAQAGKVTEQEALLKAQKFMQGKRFKQKPLRRAPQEDVNNDAYYIFNVEGRGGFVIVSGCDATPEIIGYADSGELDTNNMPENLKYWLQGYKEQISFIEKHGGSQSAPTARARIEPLIKTQWNQSDPFNRMCPMDGNVRSITGCVATAMAQVLYYHRWPQSITKPIPGYTTKSKGISVPELEPTTFEWEKMLLNYNNGAGTEQECDAVAKLMRYCGQAVEMDYTSESSGAHLTSELMIESFGYSKTTREISRSDYNTTEWESLIYQELVEKRPVLYSGSSAVAGHQFICDGYDGEGLFHINWGWGGNSDGYFVMSLANPRDKGLGGGTGSDGYAFSQRAFFGLQPASDNEQEIPVFENRTDLLVPANYTRLSENENFADISTDGCRFYAYYNYVPTTTYPIELGWAVWQNGEIIKVVANNDIIIDNRSKESGIYSFYDVPNRVSFGAGLPDGNYRLVLVWRPQSSTDGWNIISSKDAIYAEISGNALNIRGANVSPVTYTVDNIKYSGEMLEKTTNTVTIKITNTCDALQQPVYFWMFVDGTWELMGQAIGNANSGETDVVNLTFTPKKAGDFDVRITSDKDGENLIFTSNVTIYKAIDLNVDGIKYSLNSNTKKAKVTGTTLTGQFSLTIPSSVTYNNSEYTVTHIGKCAFQFTKIVSVSLPSPLKVIEDNAFIYCNNLTEVVIPEGVNTIGINAFESSYYDSKLAKLTLPSTLESIGSGGFCNARHLSAVVVNMTTPIAISSDVFKCTDEKIEFFPNATLYVPIGTKSAYQQAEGWKEFSTICEGEMKETMIDGITYRYATTEDFADIGAADGEMLNDKDLVIPSSINVDDKTYKVRRIDDGAFYGINMTSLIIEPGLEEIGESSFSNCWFKELVIPEGVKTIGNYAFAACEYLKQLSLPSTLKSIGSKAFYFNDNLNEVISNMNNPVAITPDVFSYPGLMDDDIVELFTKATLYVPIGTKSAYQQAEGWKEFSAIYEGELKKSTIDGVTYQYATGEDFADIMSADGEILNGKNLVIPNSITADDKVYKVRRIYDKVFYNMRISSLTIEPGLEEIGNECFFHGRFEEVVIPEGVKTIGNYAFGACEYLKLLSLPSTLKSIGVMAFYGDERMTDVIVNMIEPVVINSDVFTYNRWINGIDMIEYFTKATLYVPIGTKSAYQQAAVWKEFSTIYEGELKKSTIDGVTYQYATGEDFADIVAADGEMLNGKDLVIPNSITVDDKTYKVRRIGDGVFYGMKMTSLIIEPGLEEIGEDCFRYCRELQQSLLVIPEGVKSIGQMAFTGFRAEKLSLPSTLKSIGSEAFHNNYNLKAVISNMNDPVAITPDVFSYGWNDGEKDEVFTKTTLYVPIGTKSAYQQAEVWKEFTIIKEIGAPGDINADGSIDVSDAVATVNVILQDLSDPETMVVYDVNGDGEVDVFDVTKIISIILSHKGGYATPRRTMNMATENVSLTANGNSIWMGDEQAERFTAFQFDVEVPDGTELVDVSLVNANSSHQLQFAKMDENRYKVIGLSLDNELLSASAGRVIELNLAGKVNGDVRFSNIMFVDSKAEKTFFIDDILTYDTTGIYGVNMNQKLDGIYDLSGRKLNIESNQLGRGIYIINGKKVVIK